MATRKVGRPKSGKQIRSTEVTFSLTPEDAEWFSKTALELGFSSRGQFFTALAERLRLGGLAPVAFLKIGWQLGNRASETGSSKGAGFINPFWVPPPLDPVEATRPTPTLPDEDLAPSETKQLLTELRKQLQPT